jgi:ATP/ADP translocase
MLVCFIQVMWLSVCIPKNCVFTISFIYFPLYQVLHAYVVNYPLQILLHLFIKILNQLVSSKPVTYERKTEFDIEQESWLLLKV